MSHHHKQRRGRIGCLPRWQRNSTHLFFTACALSGVGFLVAHTLRWQALAEYAHAMLIAHGITAYLSVLAFGAVIPTHIRSAWKVGRNRNSGVVMIAVLATLMISGLLLYYGSEEIHDAVLWTHWIVGGAVILLFPYHLVAGRLANIRAGMAAHGAMHGQGQEAAVGMRQHGRRHSLPSSSTSGNRAVSIS